MTFQVLEVRSIYRNGGCDERQRKSSISNEIKCFDEQINVANDIADCRGKKNLDDDKKNKSKRIQMNKDHTQISAKIEK